MRYTLVLALTVAAVAACSSTPRVGYIDLARVTAESEAGKRTSAELAAAFDAKQREINQAEQQIKAAEANGPSPVDLGAKRQQLQQMVDKSQAELNAQKQAANVAMTERIRAATAALAAERKLAVVLPASTVYAQEGLDITVDVVKRLNAENDTDKRLVALQAEVDNLKAPRAPPAPAAAPPAGKKP